MTIKELNTLKKGDQVYINTGSGWRQIMTFKKVTTVISFGKHTLSDLINDKIDFDNGKQETQAICEYIDDNGKKRETYINPRKLHKYTF